MYRIVNIFSLLGFLIIISCNSEATISSGFNREKFIEGIFCSFHSRTDWKYEFNLDGTFLFESKGHFGNTHSYGVYVFNKDTIIVNSVLSNDINDTSFHQIINKKFFLKGDTCIISIEKRPKEYFKNCNLLFTE